MYTNPYSMLLNHIALQNYFENFSKFKIVPIKILFQAQRSTGSSSGLIGRPGLVVLACTFMHVCRSTGPVDRLKDPCSRVLSVDRASRPTEQSFVFD